MNRIWSRLAAVALIATATTLAVPADADGERAHRRDHHGPDGGPFGMRHFGDPERLLRHMSQTLELSDSQEENIENIINAASPEIDALKQGFRENFIALRDLDPQAADYSTLLQNLAAENGRLANEATLLHGRLRAEIHAELTPEQRQEVEVHEAELRERFGERIRHREAGN